MNLSARLPNFEEPVIRYAPHKGRIGIFLVKHCGYRVRSELLGYLR